jgi:hypothetical protein
VQFETTIRNLKKIIKDPNCKHMNLSIVKGYLGELFVRKKLEQEGYEVRQKGNQAGYDLEVNEKNITIDVKFSTYKREEEVRVRGFPRFWHWCLKHQNKKRPVSCSHIICVAADDNLDPKVYYIIESNHLDRFPKSGISQFKGVLNGFLILPDRVVVPNSTPRKLKDYISECKKLVNSGIAIKVSPNESFFKRTQKQQK